MNVRVLKLVTSEDVVSQVDQHVEGGVLTLTKPLGLAMIPLQEGGFRPSIFPWAVHVEKHTVHIREDKVVYNEPANEELKTAYTQAIGEKRIQTPPTGLAMP